MKCALGHTDEPAPPPGSYSSAPEQFEEHAMTAVASIDERRGGDARGRIAVTITGDVAPGGPAGGLAALDELWRDVGQRVLCARVRIDAGSASPRCAVVDSVVVLDDGRVLVACSVDRTVEGATRDVTRRLGNAARHRSDVAPPPTYRGTNIDDLRGVPGARPGDHGHDA
jgi:hypothetical protein